MNKSIFNPKHPIVTIEICIAGICTLASANLQAGDVQVGRYSLFSATSTEAQADLLATTMSGPVSPATQRLSVGHCRGPDTAALFALPLPAVHRSLGPMTLRDALETLVGSAFYLVQDPVHRLIAFERCAADRFVTQAMTTIEPEVAQDEE
ncbi:hypothetical protein [Candidatus Vondammii sp. HM_W22]|uniref:hypothetical protein n=1 Tax=Candidatus Vondammii sp. HM_W22 TaxID=2687299 RepID=UPI001F146772|nr:hypothetical protein [Candidatus Vondammii sp. HM_W22]